MGNVCCIRDETDKDTYNNNDFSYNKRANATPTPNDTNIMETEKVKANQKLTFRSFKALNDDLDNNELLLLVKLQANIKGFLVRNRKVKNEIKQERHSMTSNSFVSHHLNYSEDTTQGNFGEKVFIMKDTNANPLNFMDNKRRMFGKIEYSNGTKSYEGEWLNGKKDGFGIVTWQDGAVFKGFFKNDMANGLGKQLHKGGEIYLGQWINDRAEGLGIFKNTNSSKYEGEWRIDKHNGIGFQTQLNGTIYRGEFLNGEKHGLGVLQLEDGSFYEGEFENNEINGIGTFIYFDGKKYSGEWKSNRMHGSGVLVYSSNKNFEGNFEEDKKHGLGVFHNGEKIFIGVWNIDKLEGEVCVIENGKIKSSIWKEGKKVENLSKESCFLPIAKRFLN